MKQILLKKEDFCTSSDSLRITGARFNHLVRVRHLKENTLVKGLFEKTHYVLKISKIEKDVLLLDITDKIPLSSSLESSSVREPQIYLYPSLLKENKLEEVVRACVEIGVHQITPTITERSIVRSLGSQKLLRLKKILESALEQSGNEVIPLLKPEKHLSSILSEKKGEEKLIFLHPASSQTQSAFSPLGFPPFTEDDFSIPWALFIGPEGGYSPAEVALFLQHHAFPVSLGKNILRAPTASIYGLAALKTYFTFLKTPCACKEKREH